MLQEKHQDCSLRVTAYNIGSNMDLLIRMNSLIRELQVKMSVVTIMIENGEFAYNKSTSTDATLGSY